MPAEDPSLTIEIEAQKLSKPKPKSKKTPEKDPSSSTTSNDYKPMEGALSPGSQKASSTDWFTSEIQGMMYGFGDCRTPLIESAQLVEEIVHQQMNSLLVQACDVALTRGVKFIGPEDIIFLMRRDKVKLARIIKYMELKDMKASIVKSNSLDEDEATEATTSGDNKLAASRCKRVRLCQDFIASIDQTGELNALFESDVFDEAKHEREMRLEQRTRCMDQAQYLEFSEARQMSFSRKYRSTKFRDWLIRDGITELKPTAMALELFNYMAYETVAQIVDLALLVKKDAEVGNHDPLTRSIIPGTFNPGFPMVQLASLNRNTAGPGRPDSPASQMPISPPLSPNAAFGASQNSLNKLKTKKRRKSEGKQTTGILSGCIEPADIREAISRYWNPTGPLSLFTKPSNSHLYTRLLSC